MTNNYKIKNDLNAPQSAKQAQLRPQHQTSTKNSTTGLQIDFSAMLARSRTAKKHKNFISRGYNL
jgi:hypothetical protein